MQQLERVNDQLQALKTLVEGELASTWTAMPGVIDSFDPETITAVVRIAIKANQHKSDGSIAQIEIKPLCDVPVILPRGGGCVLTFPIKQGDEVLVVFASRCIDAWWQSGGVQAQAEFRMHDLSDGFAIPGPFSQVTKIAGFSADSVQLRTDDGEAYVDLNPTTKKLRLVSPVAVEIESPSFTHNGVNVGSTHVHGGVRAGPNTSGGPQ